MFNRPNGLKANFQAKDVGPGEFLYLIKNALYVLTDSFHATIFLGYLKEILLYLKDLIVLIYKIKIQGYIHCYVFLDVKGIYMVEI